MFHNKKNNLFCLSTLCGFIVLWIGSVWSSEIAQYLTYEIAVENASTSVTLGEPIVIKLVLRNSSQQDVQIEDYNPYDYMLLYANIRKPNGELFRSLKTLTEFYSEDNILKPGEYYCHYWDITTGGIVYPPQEPQPPCCPFVFNEIGRYRVVATYEKLGINSNELIIEVLPVPPGEQEAFEAFRNAATDVFIITGTSKFDTNNVAELEQFIQKFPDSIYVDYARYYVARYWVKGGIGRTQVDYNKGLSLLEQIDTAHVKFAYEFPARRLMFEAAVEKYDKQKEAQILDRFIDEFDPKNKSFTLPDMPDIDAPNFKDRIKRRILQFY